MKQYTSTDQQIHLLSQIIAKANRSFLPKKEDDSHTNLYFDSLGKRITGRWLAAKTSEILFTLNLQNLSFELVNKSQNILLSVPTIGLSIREIEEKIESQLENLGLNPEGFRDNLHYEIPPYPFSKEPISAIDTNSLNTWIHFRKMANEACSQLLGHAQVHEELRIWPHHFDTGIYFSINDNLGLGFGMAMEDEMAGSPYFYISAYPSSGEINFETKPENENWRWELGKDWKGAVLTLVQLSAKTEAEQKLILTEFISKTYHFFANQC